MASCITPIPIPAIPNPLKIYRRKRTGLVVTIPEESSTKGTKNKANIITVFTTMFALAFLLLLLVLKYVFTLFLNVFEKSGFMFLENLGCAILLFFRGFLFFLKPNINSKIRGTSL